MGPAMPHTVDSRAPGVDRRPSTAVMSVRSDPAASGAFPLYIPSMPTRFGFGYDSHRFGAQRPLKLAGVEIAHPTGLAGHSDGDAVAHAVIDALLGAAALGDIGALFPDTDPRWKGADSLGMLGAVRERLKDAGYTVVNVDTTIVTEVPRIAPEVDAMRRRLADALGLGVERISIKAKTNEKMDAVGAGDGLVVYAVAAIEGA